MLKSYLASGLLVLALAAGRPTAAQTVPTSYYFPGTKTGQFDPAIPTPEQFLGYAIGSHYTRSDQIVAYLRELDRVSDKVVPGCWAPPLRSVRSWWPPLRPPKTSCACRSFSSSGAG